MGPKKKKKDKKQKKAKENPPRILKSEYIAKIAERNVVLAAARKRIEKVENACYTAEKKYEQTQEDMADILKYLQHEIEENEQDIASYDNQIKNYKAEIAKIDKYYASINSKKEAEFMEKEKALQCQTEQNMAKLSAFEDIRSQRQDFLKKQEARYQKMREMEARHQEELYEAEKKAIIKQDRMRKEMEMNVIKLSTEFRQATDLAIGETMNKLIKENIDLGNMLTCTQEIFEKARDSYHKVYELEKEYRYKAQLFDEETQMVLQTYTKQVTKIEELLRSHEELIEKIKESEKLVKDNRRLQRQIAENECILREKIAELDDLTKTLNKNQEIFDSVKEAFNTIRKRVVNLETALFEAAKTVKHAIEIENVMEIVTEDEEFLQVDEEIQEENLIEFKYQTQQWDIEKIIENLKGGLQVDLEMMGAHKLSEMQMPSHESILSIISAVAQKKEDDIPSHTH